MTRWYLPEQFIAEVVDGVDLYSPAWSHVAMCCICDHPYHAHGSVAEIVCRCCGSGLPVAVRIERRQLIEYTLAGMRA